MNGIGKFQDEHIQVFLMAYNMLLEDNGEIGELLGKAMLLVEQGRGTRNE